MSFNVINKLRRITGAGFQCTQLENIPVVNSSGAQTYNYAHIVDKYGIVTGNYSVEFVDALPAGIELNFANINQGLAEVSLSSDGTAAIGDYDLAIIHKIGNYSYSTIFKFSVEA